MTTELHALLAPYALDALGRVEREAFEQHLGECDLCQSELAEFRAAADRLSGARPPLRPLD